MAIDAESVDQANPAETSALLINRTGIMAHAELSAQLIQGAKEITPPGSEDGDEIRIERSEYVAEALPIGSYPSVVHEEADQRGAEPAAKAGTRAFLFDKLSERLAFERQGTRLYEAFTQKLEALPIAAGEGPEGEEVRRIGEEELEHFKLLQKAIVDLGGDATVQSPSADVAGVLAHGAMQIMSDPRTTITQALQAVLTAELTDNEGWEMLQQLAEQLGYDDLATRSGEALDQEREHLDSVRTWISKRMEAELAATDENGGQESSAEDDEEVQPRRRSAKKKASRSKSKRKKK